MAVHTCKNKSGGLGCVPSELMRAFSIIFYNTPQESVFKALGVDQRAGALLVSDDFSTEISNVLGEEP